MGTCVRPPGNGSGGSTSKEHHSTMTFPIKKSSNGQWFFNVIASNGSTLATSETYWNKQDAKSAAQSIINQAGGGRIIE
jgi:uncharacterized protein YegP (UPF0339 family)